MGVAEIIDQAYRCIDGGDGAQALRLLDEAISQHAGDADLLFARGNVHRESGNAIAAAADFRDVLIAQPAHAKAHNNLGVIAQEQGDLGQAQACFEQALHVDTRFADAAFNLGTVLHAQQRMDLAVPWFERAVAWRPDFVGALLHLGHALADLGRMQEAAAVMRRAIDTDPAFAGAHNDLGLFLTEMNELAPAIAAHEQAVALAPDSDEFKTNLGLALMQSGDLARAWALYERRWRAGGQWRPAYRYDPATEWQGGTLTGKRLRVWWEQGLGDTLCFARFLPAVAAKFGPVAISLEVQPGLKRLLAHSLPGIELIEQGEAGSAYDLQVPLASLPQRCGIAAGYVPAQIPYLAPTPQSVARWQARLAQVPGPRIGVVWASGVWPGGAGPQRRLRSVDPAVFARLLEVPGVSFISLQKGAGAADAARWAAQPGFFDWTDEIADFDDTAALMLGLDLMITVDTSVAHLAGALGVPTWVPLRFEGGNLWAAGAERSAWYPAMRVFRQQQQAQWGEVMDRVTAALGEHIAAGSGA